MRISTSMQFNSGTRNILSLQYELQRAQNQLSTGRRMLSPADDPVAALNVLQVEQSKGVNEQFLANQEAARASLSALEVTLGSLGDQLVDIRTALLSAGNGGYDTSQRAMIAQELEQRLMTLVDQANAKDALGNYVFSGFQSAIKPFEFDAGLGQYVYQGDQGQVSLQVAPSVNMVIQENGSDIFMRVRDGQGSLSPNNVFQSISNAIDELKSSAFSVSALSSSLAGVDAAIDHLLLAHTSAGARLNSLDSLTINGKDLELLHEARLSELQGLDYAEAISRFSRYQTQLEASQITFKQVTQLSLFNLL